MSDPSRSPAKMTCTTCFDQRLRSGEIESTIATGPFDRQLHPAPHDTGLLAKLPLEGLRECLAGVNTATGKQPVLASALFVPDQEDTPMPPEYR